MLRGSIVHFQEQDEPLVPRNAESVDIKHSTACVATFLKDKSQNAVAEFTVNFAISSRVPVLQAC